MLQYKDLCSIKNILVLLMFLNAAEAIYHVTLNSEAWETYKTTYDKNYANATEERTALYNYNYNMKLITKHNNLEERRLTTYRLAPNQFSDRKFFQFNAQFPPVTTSNSHSGTLPPLGPSAPNFLPEEQIEFGINIEDQGTVCNSGWAYATAKAIELRYAWATQQQPQGTLSAQYLIDCAGQSIGCKKQSPYAAFNYLSMSKRPAYYTTQYTNQPTLDEQGQCQTIPAVPAPDVLYLGDYAMVSNDAQIAQLVSNLYPVVIEYNPTSFEFMHYSEGIFQQPKKVGKGSHFMTVVGFTNEYWLVANSFGTQWGEDGYIRIRRSNSVPLTKNGFVPISVDDVPIVP